MEAMITKDGNLSEMGGLKTPEEEAAEKMQETKKRKGTRRGSSRRGKRR